MLLVTWLTFDVHGYMVADYREKKRLDKKKKRFGNMQCLIINNAPNVDHAQNTNTVGKNSLKCFILPLRVIYILTYFYEMLQTCLVFLCFFKVVNRIFFFLKS